MIRADRDNDKIDIGQYVRNTSSLRPERLRLQRTRACDVTCITSIEKQCVEFSTRHTGILNQGYHFFCYD